jgi:hypothetical protein
MGIEKPQHERPKLTDTERHKRFVDTAKKIEASDKIEDFDKAFDDLRVNVDHTEFKRREHS